LAEIRYFICHTNSFFTMTFIPKDQRLTRYLTFAFIWIALGIGGAIADPGNFFFYGYPIFGLFYLYAYFTDGGKGAAPTSAENA
jgi:hypothetical protein